MLCHAALCFRSNIQQYQVWCEVPGTRYRYVRAVYSSLCFLHLIVLSRSPCPPPPANYTRTADQNVTSPTSTQHSAQHNRVTRSSQAALWHYQFAIYTKSWASFSPLYMFWLHSFLRERSERRQPPAERSPCNIITIHV